MNERIKEIALQAKQSALDAMIKIVDKEQALKVYSETYDTKFAELIVRECAKVCRDQPNVYALKADRDNCAIAIEEHFGVEE